jgi:phosphoenolpyruvate carboxykinase (GTP)
MAMLPFCGYSMGDYFRHWLKIGDLLEKPPKIFSVNWFRQDDNGSFIWPGFGDNIRVLEWIIKRAKGAAKGRRTPIGIVPNLEELNLTGLKINKENMEKLFEVNPADWKNELEDVKTFLRQFADKMPEEIWRQYKDMEEQLS